MTKTKPKSVPRKKAKTSTPDLSDDHDMAVEELSGNKHDQSLNASETDDDENEGMGGGNIERSDDDVFKKDK
jgi:hypothetical protein